MHADCQDGHIYKIHNTINDDIYIGSTSRQLCEIMRGHRSNYNYIDKIQQLSKVKLYKAMGECGVENCLILNLLKMHM